MIGLCLANHSVYVLIGRQQPQRPWLHSNTRDAHKQNEGVGCLLRHFNIESENMEYV